MNPSFPAPQRAPSLFWPIVFIGVGAIWLLSNLGMLPTNTWWTLWQFWPVLLILIGIDVLVGRRSVWGTVLSAILALFVVAAVAALLFAPQFNGQPAGFPGIFRGVDLQSQHIAQPLQQARTADVSIDIPAGRGTLTASSDPSNLLEGDVTYYGNLVNSLTRDGDRAHVQLSGGFGGIGPIFSDSGQERWDLRLNPAVAYDLSLGVSSGSLNGDLRQLTLQSLNLDVESGSATLSLPESGQYRFGLTVRSGSAEVRVPSTVAVRVIYNTQSGSFSASSLRRVSGDRNNGVYESDNFSQDQPYVIVQVDVSSGSASLLR